MNRRSFVRSITLGSGVIASTDLFVRKEKMKLHFLRHATLFVIAGDIKILVDPMLSAKGMMDPVKVSRNSDRIPLADLPIDESELKKELDSLDAVIVTHTHRDHWDEKSKELINKKLPLICQPSDTDMLKGQGFENTLSVNTTIDFKGLKISRIDGQHGTGEIGLRMGHVSGFVIEYQKQKLYIAGDTIWCTEVEQALLLHNPTHIVLNAGAARFDQGGSITMTAEDVAKVCTTARTSKVVAIHMEAVNHCDLTREGLRKHLSEKKLDNSCLIPKDGDWIAL